MKLFVWISLGSMLVTGCLPESMSKMRPITAKENAPVAHAIDGVEVSWNGKSLAMSDSAPSRFTAWPSANSWEYRFRPSNEAGFPEIKVIPFDQPWHAQRAWQSLAGERSPKGDWVRTAGAFAVVAGAHLIWIEPQGAALMSAQDLQQLQVKDWRWGEEPTFTQLFLQRHRLLGTGWVVEPGFLGLNWQGPLYAMRYAFFGDSVQVILAGPQDSTLYSNQIRQGPTWPWFASGRPQGEARLSLPGGASWNGHWGEKGLVLMEGCFAQEACRNWAQNQYQVLELFESNGFFQSKNENPN